MNRSNQSSRLEKQPLPDCYLLVVEFLAADRQECLAKDILLSALGCCCLNHLVFEFDDLDDLQDDHFPSSVSHVSLGHRTSKDCVCSWHSQLVQCCQSRACACYNRVCTKHPRRPDDLNELPALVLYPRLHF